MSQDTLYLRELEESDIPEILSWFDGEAGRLAHGMQGRITAEDSPLRHAPHTVEDLVADWDRAYSREQGCFPPASFRVDKYWPPVGRVDNVYGDRNFVCSCPPVEDWIEA